MIRNKVNYVFTFTLFYVVMLVSPLLSKVYNVSFRELQKRSIFITDRRSNLTVEVLRLRTLYCIRGVSQDLNWLPVILVFNTVTFTVNYL